MNLAENCWPTPEHLLLLQAGLLDPPKALLAWHQYCEQIDLQKADHLSTTLFPLVYHNLKTTSAPQLGLCKSVYRHTWSYNQLQFFHFKKLLHALQDAEIQTYLLKGAGMILGYYKDSGLRVMGDIDLLVPRHQAKEALHICRDLGWAPKEATQQLDIYRSHALMLKNKEGHAIDLHWNVLADNGLDALLANYIPRKQPLNAPFATAILSPADQLFHTLFHGLNYSPQPLIRWIPDAAYILTQTPNLDWPYFHHLAKQLKLELPIYTALRYLHHHSFAPIPPTVLSVAERFTPTSQQQRYFKLLARKPKKLRFILQLYWHSHRRNHRSQNPLILFFTLPRFIKTSRRLSSWYQLIPFLFRAFLIHMKKSPL
jgi:hypothetical protein